MEKLYKNDDWMYQKYMVEELSTQKIADLPEAGTKWPQTIWRKCKELGFL